MAIKTPPLSRQAREKRADQAAKRAEAEPGVYARALERLYAAALIPAWVGKRASHPSLYDRMLRAGVTPDFDRPNKPATWPVVVSTLYACLVAWPFP